MGKSEGGLLAACALSYSTPSRVCAVPGGVRGIEVGGGREGPRGVIAGMSKVQDDNIPERKGKGGG